MTREHVHVDTDNLDQCVVVERAEIEECRAATWCRPGQAFAQAILVLLVQCGRDRTEVRAELAIYVIPEQLLRGLVEQREVDRLGCGLLGHRISHRFGSGVVLQICTLPIQSVNPNSYRLTNNPMTRSCIWTDLKNRSSYGPVA